MVLNIVNGRVQPRTKSELDKYIIEYQEIADKGYPIGTWDVSLITNMSKLFANMDDFNEDISNWDVSNVTDMNYMFMNCENFNQPLDTWNVSNVTSMISMFYNCATFNQSLNNWNVSNVTNMEGMFNTCLDFNEALHDWNVSNVTNMECMFMACELFNQSLNNWNVSNVTNMERMFMACESFNQSLDNWNVSNVRNMKRMFMLCNNFDQPVLWKKVNIHLLKNRKNIEYMFEDHYAHLDKGMGLLYSNQNARKKYIKDYNDRLNYEKMQGEVKVKSRRPTSSTIKTHTKLNSIENLFHSNPGLRQSIGDFIGPDLRNIGGKRKTQKKKTK